MLAGNMMGHWEETGSRHESGSGCADLGNSRESLAKTLTRGQGEGGRSGRRFVYMVGLGRLPSGKAYSVFQTGRAVTTSTGRNDTKRHVQDRGIHMGRRFSQRFKSLISF